ncbi:serine hydrolase domain-containing protein [Rathayibacter soli]|uniref:serine hydrolase domain-containing protein n=1 Tax=Rathayibacter soli TaxID=3144168 RepID=UPI0027E47401|nr:serine hydrolase domain-containing protein [Glaciibacter superstes]
MHSIRTKTRSAVAATAHRRGRGWVVLGLGAAVMLAVSGCTAGASSATPTQVPTVKPVAGSAAACVPNPKQVATQKDTQSTKPMPAALAGKYDAVITAEFAKVRESAPSVIVGVRSPKGTWEKAYGLADIATKTASTTDMYQRVGSVTKTFVATAVLQLADQGKLSLDDPIDDYVAGVPNGTHITLRELITMTSGLGNYAGDPQWYSDALSQPERQWTPRELLDVAYSMPTSFPPGTNWEYSNTNYILLGQVIEYVTGKPWEDVVTEQILKPLHLTSTQLPTGNIMPSPHANGYTHDTIAIIGATPTNAWTDATDFTPSCAGAAGSMISRVGDLLTWGRALATGQGMLPTPAQVQRLSSFGSTHGFGAGFFYGDGLECSNGWIGHGGTITGYNTELRYNPSIQTTVVVEATGDGATATPPRVLTNEVLASALAKIAGHAYPAVVIPPAAQVQGPLAPDPFSE